MPKRCYDELYDEEVGSLLNAFRWDKILPPAYPFVPPPLPPPSYYQRPLHQPFPFIGPYQQHQRSNGSRTVPFYPLSPEGFGVSHSRESGFGIVSGGLASGSKRSDGGRTNSISSPGGHSNLVGVTSVQDSKPSGMALRDENADDEKEEKPKVYKSADSEESDVKPEKNDVCLEAEVQCCPSTSGSALGAGPSSSDGIPKHPSKDGSSTGASTASTIVNGASPNSGNAKSSNVGAATVASTNAETLRSTAFTRTNPNRINGLDAIVNLNGLSANGNYYVGVPPLAYIAAAGPSSGGSSTSTHGVIHPMASYPANFPALYQAAATAHLMGNRFPGSPNAASSPFSFQPGTAPFAGFSPCYPSAPDGGQTAPSQGAAGQAAFPFMCGDPKTAGIRSPFGFFSAGQYSPTFCPQLFVQSSLEQWYAAQRYSQIFPLMMTAAATSAPVPCSPSAGTLSPIVNSSPIAGAAHSLTPGALAPPTLIPAFHAAPYAANNLRFPPTASSTATNALAAMSQIPLPVATTSVKSVVNNLAAHSSLSNAVSRGTQNGSAVSATASTVPRNRIGSNASLEQRLDENGTALHSNATHASSSRSSHEKASKKSTHIKKPLNAFMLYMKEMRPNVMQEVGLKERQSAEINRILGRRWHSLTREEQQKYYDMARQERTLHMQRYPNWSARDNYALHKKKKRKRDKAQENLEMKKCRARFGLEQQGKWCKHCRRKKKCLWFREGNGVSSAPSSSGAQAEAGVDSAAEQSPPCAQVTSTTSGPDVSTSSATALATETDVNSPQSLVTSTISIGSRGQTAPPSANSVGSTKKKASGVSTAAVSKYGSNNTLVQSPSRKRNRPTDAADDDDHDDSSSGSDDDDVSSGEEEFDEDEIDEEAEAAAAAKAAAEGADFDDEMTALISPMSADQKDTLPEDDQPSTVA